LIPLLVATSNPGKLKEFSQLLRPMFLCESLPPNTFPVLEDGKTYRENALKKAEGYFKRFNKPVLSDDSGLEIDALGGAPGVDSAIYGGESISWPARWDFLYQQLGDLRQTNPLARFRCVLCYYDGVNPPRLFEATTEGHINSKPKGTGGFGYDPIFYSRELGKTLGEAGSDEKALISHRARAVKKFIDFIKSQA